MGRGTGLGLSQVYGFVSQSGGRIHASATPGEGAIFELMLPLTDEQPLAAAVEAEVEIESGSERVLIVEDDPAVLGLCLDMLTSLGYRCDVASDASGALRRLDSDPDYDLLFSDVVMPGGMNGIELAQKAQERRPDLKVLLTSGYVGETGHHMQHDFPLIDKPYQCADLATRLRAVLGSPGPMVAAKYSDSGPDSGVPAGRRPSGPDEITCFAVTASAEGGDSDKRLKTSSSERLIPVHPELLDLGFMTFVAGQRERREIKLFAEVGMGATGYRSTTFSSWFTRFTDRRGRGLPRPAFTASGMSSAMRCGRPKSNATSRWPWVAGLDLAGLADQDRSLMHTAAATGWRRCSKRSAG